MKRFLGLMFLFLLAACSSGSEKRQISFRIFGDPAEKRAYEALVAAFELAHPDIDVQLSHIPSPREYRTRLVTDFAAGTPPDVTLMNYRRFSSFAANELLEPVGPYLAQSELIAAEDFYPIAVESFTWNGELACLPQNISSLVVYYNADLFAAAGLPEPDGSWDWDQFVMTAKALTHDLDGDGTIDQYGLGMPVSLYRVAPFVWQNGGKLVDDRVRATSLLLHLPASQEAVQWFVDLRQVHGVVPDRLEEASFDSESRFVAGVTAMFLNSRRGTPAYREINGFRWDVAPLPHKTYEAGILHSDGYCMSATAVDKEAVWRFVEFANSPEGQTIIAGSGRTVPSLITVAESDAFLNPGLSPSRSDVFIAHTDVLQTVPVISTWEEIEGVTDQELERAFYGDITVEEAILLAQQRTSEYFLRAIYADKK